MNITEKLDRLADMYAHKELVQINKKELIEAIIPKEVKEKLSEVEDEFGEKLEMLDENIAKLVMEVKEEVILNGESVKSKYLHAIYSKPRTTYDSKKLETLEKVYPLLVDAKKIGEPSVSIRTI